MDYRAYPRVKPEHAQRSDRRPRAAQRAGVCRECGRPYAAGDPIYWAPGIGAAHEACQWAFRGNRSHPLAPDATPEADLDKALDHIERTGQRPPRAPR